MFIELQLKSRLPISEFSGYLCKNSLNTQLKGFIKLLVSGQKRIDNHHHYHLWLDI